VVVPRIVVEEIVVAGAGLTGAREVAYEGAKRRALKRRKSEEPE
jgi:hypothetical protein